MKILFYIETVFGCGIRTGEDEEEVEQREERKGIKILEIREATKADIAWVRGFGGRIPIITESI